MNDHSRILGVSVRGWIALIVVSTVCAMSMGAIEVKEPLYTLAGLVVGFYFGQSHKPQTQKDEKSPVKTLPLIIIAALLSVLPCTSRAQTTNAIPDLMPAGTAGQITAGFKDWLDNHEAALTASNYVIAPYATISVSGDSPEKFGGGIFVGYRVTDFAYAGVGLDWLGQLTMPSGNIQLKADVKPFAWLGFATNFVVRPFVIGGLATPIGGAADNNWSLATIAGGGASIPVAKLSSRVTASLGGAFVNWSNCGVYSGNRAEIFASFHLNRLGLAASP